MMGAVRHIAQQSPLVEHRGHHREIGQVRTSMGGMIHQGNIAFAQIQTGRDGTNAHSEGPEMHRHVRCIHDQPTFRIEQATGVIETLLHVHRQGGTTQRFPHVAGDGFKATGDTSDSAGAPHTRPVRFPEFDDYVDTAVYDRAGLKAGERFDGPAVIEENESTLIVGPGATIEVDPDGNLLVTLPEDD